MSSPDAVAENRRHRANAAERGSADANHDASEAAAVHRAVQAAERAYAAHSRAARRAAARVAAIEGGDRRAQRGVGVRWAGTETGPAPTNPA